jgi:hypothetical protein
MQDDITRACKLLHKTAGDLGMTEVDVETGDRLLKEYGDKRDDAFSAMITMLGRSDESGIDEDWKDCCSRGKEALSHLNDDMPPKDGEGLAGVGVDAFYRGELKMWEQNSQAKIAFFAQEIETIKLIHEQLIEDCKETLETIKDKDGTIQEAVRGIFASAKSTLWDLGVNVGKLVIQALSSHKFDWAKPYTDQAFSLLSDIFKSARDLARQRGVLKNNLIAHAKTIHKTQDEVGKWKLDETLTDGAAAADSLLENKDGDYEARDWADFVVQCKQALNIRYEAADARSEELNNSIDPVVKQRIATDFKTLYDDEAKLISWLNEFDSKYSDLKSLIKLQEQSNSKLVVGSMRDGIGAVIATLWGMFDASFLDYSKMKEDILKEMNQQ